MIPELGAPPCSKRRASRAPIARFGLLPTFAVVRASALRLDPWDAEKSNVLVQGTCRQIFAVTTPLPQSDCEGSSGFGTHKSATVNVELAVQSESEEPRCVLLCTCFAQAVSRTYKTTASVLL